MTITDPKDIRLFQMRAQLACLYLEIKGMRRRGGSMYAHVKRTYGFKGDKQKVYSQFKAMIDG